MSVELVHELRFDMGDSASDTFPDYPTGFDPVTAPQEQLAHFGLPLRPDAAKSPHMHHLWATMYKRRPRFISPKWMKAPLPKRTRPATPRSKPSLAPLEVSFWAGAGFWNPPAGSVFTTIGALWDAPAATAPDSGYGLLSWVGIGGWPDGGLTQIGTWHRFSDTGDLTISAWWEWFPDGSLYCDEFDISPGDALGATVTGTSSSTATYTFGNITKNLHMSIPMTAPNGYPFIGDTAEWMLERPGGTQPLCNFQPSGMALASADYADAVGAAAKGALAAQDPSSHLQTIVNATGETLATAGFGATPLGPAVVVTYLQAQ